MQDTRNKIQGTNWKLMIGICLVIVSCILVIPPKAEAQPVYQYFYPVIGGVSDPDSVGTDSRQVVFYQTDAANGYADDIVGLPGLRGVANEYAINISEDHRMQPLRPGPFFVAIVNDNPADPAKGYGADPVAVTISGKGYDVVPTNLVLMRGAGIAPPGERPAFGLPRIENITFGNRRYQAALVARGEQFIVSAQPRISARAVSSFGLDTSLISMVVNEGTANAKIYDIRSAHIVRAAGPTDSPTEVDFIIDLLQEKAALPEGDQTITFKAANAYGSTSEVTTVTVAGGEPRLIGVPITYPSPLRLKTDQEVTFQYTLSHDINIEMFVFDVAGRVVLKRVINSRDEGGSAGINKVTWNLITDQGLRVSSGIYVFTLVSKDTGKMLGKGKFTALP